MLSQLRDVGGWENGQKNGRERQRLDRFKQVVVSAPPATSTDHDHDG